MVASDSAIKRLISTFCEMLQRNLTPSFIVLLKEKLEMDSCFQPETYFLCKKKKRSPSSHASIRQRTEIHRVNLMQVRLTRTSSDQFDLQTDKFAQTHTLKRTLSLTDREAILFFYSLWREHLHRSIKPAWHLNAAALPLHLHTLGGGCVSSDLLLADGENR